MKSRFILCLVAAAMGFAACSGNKPAEQKKAEATFSVATYNIRQANHTDSVSGNGWGQRYPYICQLVKYHGFDIFGTQEAFRFQIDDMLSELPGYAFIGVARDDGKESGEHSAIFYRTDRFELLDHGDFWLSETPEKPGLGWDAACVRICTWGKFRHIATGREFLYFNLHMDHIGVTARKESAKLVKARVTEMGSLPYILTGDFNVDQESDCYQTVVSDGKLLDAHDIAENCYEMNGTFNGFSTDSFSKSRIDHIFLTPDFTVSNYGILTDTYRVAKSEAEAGVKDGPSEISVKDYEARVPSDHFPVKAVVTLH